MTTPNPLPPRLPEAVRAQLYEQGAAAARRDAATRATTPTAPRSRNPLPHNSRTRTGTDAAAAWAAGYSSVAGLNLDNTTDEPGRDYPPYTYPPPRL